MLRMLSPLTICANDCERESHMRLTNSCSMGGIRLAVGVALVTGVVTWSSRSSADDPATLLKAMTTYVASQNVVSAAFDSDVEVVTPELQKIQFTSSGQVLLNRPDKIRVTRTGGYTDVEMVFDGKMFTLLGKNLNAYVQSDMPGSLEQMVDQLHDKYQITLPGLDLLHTNAYDILMNDVIEAKHIGRGVVDGVECEHLAFRGLDTDWQIWIEVGQRPIPRKYVITSKTTTGAPQYTLRVKDWKTDAQVATDSFSFKEPSGAKKANVASLSDFDEIPPGVVGAKK